MIIKTIIVSIILIFLLQQIYNFVYEHFLDKSRDNIKFTEIEKYKKIAEEATAAAAAAAEKNNTNNLLLDAISSPDTQQSTEIETIYDVSTTEPAEMENYLLNLVING